MSIYASDLIMPRDSAELLLKRLRNAKSMMAKAERKRKEGQDIIPEGWDNKQYIEHLYKNNPSKAKRTLKEMREGGERLQIERVCMGCGVTDIGIPGTLVEVCDECLKEMAANFGKITVLQTRLNIDRSDMRGAICPWCETRRAKRIHMVNVYMCPKCMRKIANVVSQDKRARDKHRARARDKS